MTMSNLHPGFILIAVGLIALFVPKSLRRPVLAAGPLVDSLFLAQGGIFPCTIHLHASGSAFHS